MNNFTEDESPISDSLIVCDEKPGCWCLFDHGFARLCNCVRKQCHPRKTSQTPARRKKWNGESY